MPLRPFLGALLAVATLVAVVALAGPAHAKGGVKTPFETTATCSGTELAWTLTLGRQTGQRYAVVLDSATTGGTSIGSGDGSAGGTYFGTTRVSPGTHAVLFRRIVEGKVEEAVSRTVVCQ